MATFYLPSSGGYATGNSHTTFQIKVVESANYQITLSLIASKATTSSTASSSSGSVTFYVNGTSIGTTSFGTTSINAGSSVTMATKTYTFSSAVKSATITADFKMPNCSVGSTTGKGGSVTFSTYTVSYNANGGSGAPSAQNKWYNTALTLSSTKPTRSGYNFLGWSTSSSATTATYNAGSSYTSNASTTLYAVWTQSSMIQTIMAKYQNIDGSWGEYSTVYSAALSSGATCSWSQVETNEFEAVSVSYTVSKAETRYVDIKRKQYTVSFNANGGRWNPPTITYFYGGDVFLKKRPTRSGYIFLGWGTSSTATKVEYTTTDMFNTTNTSNPTYYAIWSERPRTSSGFGNEGEIYGSSVIEETLNNGNFAIGSDFTANRLCEGKYYKYYLVDNDGNQLIDNNGNYLFNFVENKQQYITTNVVYDVELLTSNGYVLKDSNGLKLIAGRNE